MPVAPTQNPQVDATVARATQALRECEGVLAVCLVGSMARGDARSDSDIDLLVVGTRPVRDVVSSLPGDVRDGRVSLIYRTPSQVRELAEQGSLFFHHARTEGRVLADPAGVLAETFAAADGVPLDTHGEIRRRADGLRHFRHLERFGGRYRFALADLYGIAKGIALAWCAELGQPTFVKGDALAEIARLRPELRDDVATIARLRPFYDLARGHDGETLPFDPVAAEAELVRAVEAVTRLADAADPVR